ncbi:MAG TPA: S8 family serine peptidase [Candidatus Tidjanibacter gallistercoris]|nr:S8 family serine peptidase [Candidatus Tidjanibacter gallistercoris]
MKRYYYLLALAAAVVFASCVRDVAVSDASAQEDGIGDYDDRLVVPGWIRIRLDDESSPLRTGVFTRGEADSGNPVLDELAASLGATEIRQVFPTDPRFEARHRRYGLHLWFDIRLGEEVPVSRAEQEFASLPGVKHAQPIYRIVALDGPDFPLPSEMAEEGGELAWTGSTEEMPFNDPGLPFQWHYDNDGSMINDAGDRVAREGADIGLFEAWEMYGAGDPSVIVAVMDTGVFSDHEDLRANMWVNEAELNGAEYKDDDGNGYTDDIHGYDFYKKSSYVEPGEHGTHVAGTIAAVNDNGIGVSGIAGGTGNGDGARIMTCAIYDHEGYGTATPTGYIYAADNGAVISQNSWNYPMTNILPEDMSVAFDYFIENAGMSDADGDGVNDTQTGPMKGGVIIFAAGNEYSPTVGCPSSDSRVITVTSMRPDYKKAGYSNYGTGADIFAPGGAGEQDTEFTQQGQVYSTGLDNAYTYHSGTSMACPHVSGIAALIVSHFGTDAPGFTNEDLKTILLRSYRNVGEWQDTPTVTAGLGVGLVDASLIELENPGVAPAAPSALEVAEGTKEGKLTVRVLGIPTDGNDMGISYVNIRYAPEGTAADAEGWEEAVVPCRVEPGQTLEYEVTELADATTYLFEANAMDRFGNESEYVSGTGRTIDHVNRPPEIMQPLSKIMLPEGTGEDRFTATVELTEYFTDPDLPDDELTYAVSSRDTVVVKVSVSGSVMTLEGYTEGSTYASVTVTDLAGESITKNMAVVVLEDREQENPPTPPTPPEEEETELAEGVLNLFPNPVHDDVLVGIKDCGGKNADLRVYDAAARLVVSADGVSFGTSGKMKDIVKYGVSGLAPGIYTMVVVLEDGREFRNTFVKA